jgi:hypothetical protein
VPLPRLELGQAQGPTDFESVVSTNSTRAAIISIGYMVCLYTLPSINQNPNVILSPLRLPVSPLRHIFVRFTHLRVSEYRQNPKYCQYNYSQSLSHTSLKRYKIISPMIAKAFVFLWQTRLLLLKLEEDPE